MDSLTKHRFRSAPTLLALLWCCQLSAQCIESDNTASGYVFEDSNSNGVFDSGEPGVGNVSVSNGCEVTSTDNQGRYQLPLADGEIVFISKPAAYRVPVDANQLPQFYYRHYPSGSPSEHSGSTIDWQWPVVESTGPMPSSINFPLYRDKDFATDFRAHAFADTQAMYEPGQDMVREDLVTPLIGNPYEVEFGITVGDVVFDTLSLYERHKSMMSLLAIPQYYLPGNHDINFRSPTAELANETFKRHFGPIYYSFNHGNVHFVALNNVEYGGDDIKFDGSGGYRGFISERQLHWLRQDLEQVSPDTLLVIATHIPLISEATDGQQFISGPATSNFDQLLEILQPFENIYAMAGHDTSSSWKVEVNHTHGWQGKPFIAHTLAEVRGNGWTRGPADLRQVRDAMMQDGNPNGFYVMHFKDKQVVPEFKPFPFGSDAGKAMRIILEPALAADGQGSNPAINRGNVAANTKIVVNLFDGGVRDSVRLSLDGGEFSPMRYIIRNDPLLERLQSRFAGSDDAFSDPVLSAHIWEADLPASLPPGIHHVTVSSEDEFGQIRQQSLSFEISH